LLFLIRTFLSATWFRLIAFWRTSPTAVPAKVPSSDYKPISREELKMSRPEFLVFAPPQDEIRDTVPIDTPPAAG